MSEATVNPEQVYYHDCPALGKNKKIIKAYREVDGVVVGYIHKCPFCSQSAGEFVDMSKSKSGDK